MVLCPSRQEFGSQGLFLRHDSGLPGASASRLNQKLGSENPTAHEFFCVRLPCAEVNMFTPDSKYPAFFFIGRICRPSTKKRDRSLPYEKPETGFPPKKYQLEEGRVFGGYGGYFVVRVLFCLASAMAIPCSPDLLINSKNYMGVSCVCGPAKCWLACWCCF